MRKFNLFLSLVALIAATAVRGDAQDPKSALQQKLQSQYALTQATADNSDIVTAGCVLVLKKSNLMMAAVTSSDLYQNTYKDGKIDQNFAGKSRGALTRLGRLPGMSAASGPPTRTFVAGEKLWVTGIIVRDDGIVFNLFTDPFSDVRYKASLKFPNPKGAIPPSDQAEKTIAEVFSIQPDDAKSADKPAAAGAPAAPPAAAPVSEAAPAPLPPPPPPADQPPAPPKTIAVGQTIDQVLANWGQPQKIVKLSTKQIYIYPDMKVTFIKDKVTDVQ